MKGRCVLVTGAIAQGWGDILMDGLPPSESLSGPNWPSY
jgi:hypothetical protein